MKFYSARLSRIIDLSIELMIAVFLSAMCECHLYEEIIVAYFFLGVYY